MRRFCILAVLLLCGAVAAQADSVNIGDIYLQQDDSLGTVTINVDNNTGPAGEFFPDFPVTDSLDFNNLTLTLNCYNASCQSDLGGISETINWGTLSSGTSTGSYPFNPSLSFNSADEFSSIILTADLSLASLNIDNGLGGTTPFTGSPSVSFTFSPMAGPSLVPIDPANSSPDVGVFADPGTSGSTMVPEPNSSVLLGIGLTLILMTKASNLRRRTPKNAGSVSER